MRVYIIGNDGITLCRTAPATVNDGERADARSVKQPVRFRAQCLGRRSDAALRRGPAAHPRRQLPSNTPGT